MHIIHHWPDDALKVVVPIAAAGQSMDARAVTYDGTGKAAGVHVYVNGEPQPTNVDSRHAYEHDSHRRAIQDRPAEHDVAAVQDVAMQDVRVYGRGACRRTKLHRTREVLAAARFFASRRPSERSRADLDELFDWWLTMHDAEYRNLEKQTRLCVREQADIKTRGTIAHVMQEKPEAPMAYVLYPRRVRQAQAIR